MSLYQRLKERRWQCGAKPAGISTAGTWVLGLSHSSATFQLGTSHHLLKSQFPHLFMVNDTDLPSKSGSEGNAVYRLRPSKYERIPLSEAGVECKILVLKEQHPLSFR